MKKGLELARAYYEQYGRPMLEKEFPDVLDRIAAGLCGHGSECFGYDDEVSRDHDFEPGFCLWLTDEDERAFGFRLFRAYRRLPQEFEGIRLENKSLFGSDFKGVHTIRQFFSFYIGERLPETNEEWLQIPDLYLAEATNGDVFADPLGEFTKVRNALLDRPEDVRLKKIAARAVEMAQSGQYNYLRCLRHGEAGSAQLALTEFVRSSCSMIFLLNRRHEPYYKWVFRAMTELDTLSSLKDALEFLLLGENDSKLKAGVIEDICSSVISELRAQELTDSSSDYLEDHAFEVQERITSPSIRAMHIMEG